MTRLTSPHSPRLLYLVPTVLEVPAVAVETLMLEHRLQCLPAMSQKSP
jgi:hypothetical protein